MEESNFDRLLYRYITGKATEDEKHKLDTWLDSLSDVPENFAHLSREDEEELFRRISSNLFSTADVVEMKSRLKRRPLGLETPQNRKPFARLAVAASLVVAMVASYMIWFNGTDETKHGALSEQREKTVLQDGSVIWCSKDTKLTYRFAAGERVADLTGEAFFEVARDPEQPFLVHCGDVQIKVLGTSFNVKTNNRDVFEVQVISGSVYVSATADSSRVTLAANEKAVFDKGRLRKTGMAAVEAEAITADIDYYMQFRKTALADVIHRLERKFDVSILLAYKGTGQCNITVDLTGYTLEEALQILTEILDVTWSREGRDIVIAGNGC